MSITAMHRVSTRSERLSLSTSIRCITSSLTVGNVRGNGQNGGCRDTISVGVMSSYSGHEGMNSPLSDLVYAIIIITVLREVAGCLEVNDDAVLITDRLNLCVLDSGQGVSNDRQTCNTGSKVSLNVSVMKSHLCSLIAVLVMHIVDDVQSIYIYVCLPLDHVNELAYNIIIVQNIADNRTILRTNLLLGNFVYTAVESVQQTLSKVSTSAEELHFLTDNHGGYAACDTVVIAMSYSHQVVVLVLDGRGCDGDLSTVLLPALGKSGGPENCQVGLG